MSEVRLDQSQKSYSVLAIIGAILLVVFLAQFAGYIFIGLGIPLWLVILIVPGSLLGSLVNIKVGTIKASTEDCIQAEYLSVWGISYRVYAPECQGELELSVNLGGAIIPTLASVYLILTNIDLVLYSVIAVIVVAVFVKGIARVEPNVGIVTPALLPPLIAGISASLLMMVVGGLSNPYVIAYVAGTLGTLIGADMLNLNKLGELRSGKASIGGAGTWDGVFLSGLLAVLFV